MQYPEQNPLENIDTNTSPIKKSLNQKINDFIIKDLFLSLIVLKLDKIQNSIHESIEALLLF